MRKIGPPGAVGRPPRFAQVHRTSPSQAGLSGRESVLSRGIPGQHLGFVQGERGPQPTLKYSRCPGAFSRVSVTVDGIEHWPGEPFGAVHPPIRWGLTGPSTVQLVDVLSPAELLTFQLRSGPRP